MIETKPLDEIEIYHTDKFLEFIYSHKKYFGHAKFDDYKNANNQFDIYTLVNHRSFVITMITPPNDDKSKEIFGITEKAIQVYDLGGYKNWMKFNEEEIKYRKNFPLFSRINLWSTPLLGLLILIAQVIETCNSTTDKSQVEYNILNKAQLSNMPESPHSLKDTCSAYSIGSHVVE